MMATCKECLHHGVCEDRDKLMLTVNNIFELMYQHGVEHSCVHFKSTADVVPKSDEGAECPTCHGTGRIGTTDWLTKNISKKQLAEEKAQAIAEHEQHIKTEVAREIFEEIEKHLIFNTYGIATISDQTFAELKKKYVKDCRTCKHLVSCEPNPFGICDQYKREGDG